MCICISIVYVALYFHYAVYMFTLKSSQQYVLIFCLVLRAIILHSAVIFKAGMTTPQNVI